MKIKTPTWHDTGVCLITALMCSTLLSGCATMGGTSLQTYNKPEDACNTFRQPLISTGEDLKKWVIGGAAVGALAGAGIAALLGGDTQQIVGGAAAGALAGAAAGYLTARKKEADTQAELVASIDSDAVSDSVKVREVTTAIDRLGSCRQRQIEEVKVAFSEGEMSKSAAVSRANQIQTAVEEDNELIGHVFGRVDERLNTYVDAKAEVMEVEREKVEPAVAQADAASVGVAIAAFEVDTATGTFVTKRASNIRKSPKTTAQRITTLPANEAISVTGLTTDGKWYAFTHEGQPAFIYATLVTKAPEGPPADAIGSLAMDTQNARVTHQAQITRTERDMETLNILLS